MFGKITMVRATHRYGFRSGQWATLMGHVDVDGHPCMEVRFADGATDRWRVFDPDDPYEFRVLKHNAVWTRHFFFSWNDKPSSGEPLVSGCMARNLQDGRTCHGWKVRLTHRWGISFGSTFVKRMPQDRLVRWRAA